MEISERVSSIKQALAANSDEKAKGAVKKFIPTSQHVYGVRLPLLNQIAKEHREGGFELVEALWKSGAFEEKLLAANYSEAPAKKILIEPSHWQKNLRLRLATGPYAILSGGKE